MWPLSVAGLADMEPLCTPERNSSKRPSLRVVMWVGLVRDVIWKKEGSGGSDGGKLEPAAAIGEELG